MKIIKGLGNSLILFLFIISAILFINVIPSFAADTCTGGTVTTSGGYTIHTFTSSGTFSCSANVIADVLFVAGGGGGGSNRGSGGGAGGLITGQVEVPADTYTITVGAGGLGGTDYGQGDAPKILSY